MNSYTKDGYPRCHLCGHKDSIYPEDHSVLCSFRNPMRTQYSLQYLKNLPTLCIGQADNLKIDTRQIRVWLSRCSIEDGEPYNNKVTIEVFVNGCWETHCEYEAR